MILFSHTGYQAESKRNGRLAPIEESNKLGADALAYRRLEALCESIRAELENDRLIAQCAVFPVGIDLCTVTAPEYCQVHPSHQAAQMYLYLVQQYQVRQT